MRKDLPDVRFNTLGRLDQVRVSTWPDGVELWRTDLSIAGPDDPTARFTFRTAEERTDWPTTDAMDAVGFRASFILLPNVDPPLLSTSSNDDEIGPFTRHGRWVLSALGMLGPQRSPCWHKTGSGASSSSDVDPFVMRLSMPWEEAFGRARQLDVEIREVSRKYRQVLLDGHRDRFVDVAVQMGRDNLVDDVVFFLDDLVQIGWVKLASVNLKMSGELHGKLLRQTGPGAEGVRKGRVWTSATATPAGWSTTSSLDLARLTSLVDILDWLRDDARHPSVLVRTDEAFDQWFEENTFQGQLTMGDEEVEVYRLLGEDLPYLWLEPKLRAWALDRWR